MVRNFIEKYKIILILFILLSSYFIPIAVSGENTNKYDNECSFIRKFDEIKQAPVTCYANGPENSLIQHTQNLSSDKIKLLFTKLSELNLLISQKSSKKEISILQNEIITMAKNYSLLPDNYKIPDLPFFAKLELQNNKRIMQEKFGSLDFWRFQVICNFISFGSGSTGPFFAFPRLTPILLFPIPRLFITWTAEEGFTSCGGFLRMLGYIAIGQQKGFALGFWGIGFSVFLPPVSAYGVFGYTGFVGVTADEFIGYPFPLLLYLLFLYY